MNNCKAFDIIMSKQLMLEDLMNELAQTGALLDENYTYQIMTSNGTIYFGGAEIRKLKEKARKYDAMKELTND